MNKSNDVFWKGIYPILAAQAKLQNKKVFELELPIKWKYKTALAYLHDEAKRYVPEWFTKLKLEKYNTFIDVGCYIGMFSAHYLNTNPTGKAYLFDINPNCTELVAKATEDRHMQNRQIIRKCGLSNKQDTPITAYYKEKYSPLMTFTKSKNMTIAVRTERLDDLEKIFFNPKKPILMKIDVEGHEPQVLEGAQKTIKKYKPDIIFEANKKNKLEKCTKILTTMNYKTNKLNWNNFIATIN